MKSSLSKKKKIGYAGGILTESLIYNMFYTYYLTFLVQIIHIKPAVAGIVIFISIAWDAITDPLIGNYTDRQGVDKRKVMAKALVPLGITYIFAWSPLGAGLKGDLAKMILYTVLTMLVWVFYTFYTIPYYAVVAEITEDYDERTEIRSISSLINAGGVGAGNILPTLATVVGSVIGMSMAYCVISGIISILAVAFGLICIVSLKSIYLAKAEKNGDIEINKGVALKETISSFGEILKLKPFLIFILFVFFFLAGSSMIQSNLTYMVVDCIAMDYDTGIAMVIVTLVVAMAITVPLVTKLSEKTDRRTCCIVFFTFTIAGEIVCKIAGLDFSVGSFKIMAIAAPFILGVGAGTFWTLFYSMCYDLVELDEFKSGKRRESIITAFPQLVQKFGSAFGILAQGVLLSAYGYNADNDIAGNESLIERISDEKIINGMENISTIIPAILIGFSLVMLIIYPVTRERVSALNAALAKKRNNEPYSTDGFEKLL